MARYTGLIPAAYTSFAPDGTLDLGPVADMAALFAGQQLPAAFVCGTTGEAHSLTVAERKAVAERWRAVAPAGLDVIVHVGHNCQRDAADLAAHACTIGAAAVAGLAPSYFRPASVDDLVDFLAPVAAAAGDLPFYYYVIPDMTGVRLPADAVFTALSARVPNFAGLKFTGSDLMRLQSCLALAGDGRDVLFGSDEMLLAAVALGARGAVGSTYNYAAPLYQRVLAHAAAGAWDAARAEQRKSVAIVGVLYRHGGLRVGKAIMKLIGIDCGPVRPPLRAVDDAELRAIRAGLAGLEDAFVRPVR